MAIKWRSVKITDNRSGKVHLGFKARQFIRENCPDAISDIQGKSLADTVRVKISAEKTSLDLNDIKDVLSKALSKFDASLEILEDTSVSREVLPVARKAQNSFNDKKTRLKVEFFYTRDPKGTSARVYLENSKVTVTAQLEGAMQPIKRITDKGKANFGLVKPGKYTIIADYPESDECKYDWILEKQDVQLSYGTEEIVEFEVEPLYQKVEFIAHCLTTIPHQIYVPSDEDKDKLDITESDGKIKVKFKNRPQTYWTWGELPSEVKDRALRDILPGKKNAIKMRKNSGTNQFWTLEDIKGQYEDKIDLGVKMTDTPEKYEFTFKEKARVPYSERELTGEWKSKYHGDVDDLKDIEARVKFIGDTLEKAYAESNREATVLKVFMIPECFFQGLYGAYISDDAAELVGKLQNLVKDKKWKDWIFSFGTLNRVFLGLQPNSVTGGEKNKTIYEMANHAPVIRGGLEQFEFLGDDSTRLIQKLINSLELAGKDDLIKDPKITELVKKKEEMVKEMEESVKQGKLNGKELENEIKRLMRIRPQAVNEDVQFEGTENDELVARLLEKLLEDNTINSAGLRGDAKENEIKVEIKNLGIARVVRQMRTTKEDDIFSTWRERLKVYDKKLDAAQELNWKERLEAAEKLIEEEKLEKQKIIEEEKEKKKSKKPVPFDFGQAEKAGMSLEDYVFACPRKPGPLFKNLVEARKVKSCKRVVFGLEICADHGDWRLIEINTGVNYIDIDIQLVPSAGQKPRKFAARKEGYIFNCDGWNSPPTKGGRSVETHLDGPSPYVIGIKQTSPIYPHSAAIKRTTDEIDVGAKECLKPEKFETLSEELTKVIFGYGAGELHFYPLQDLPK